MSSYIGDDNWCQAKVLLLSFECAIDWIVNLDRKLKIEKARKIGRGWPKVLRCAQQRTTDGFIAIGFPRRRRQRRRLTNDIATGGKKFEISKQFTFDVTHSLTRSLFFFQPNEPLNPS